jgi:hypothetical protein
MTRKKLDDLGLEFVYGGDNPPAEVPTPKPTAPTDRTANDLFADLDSEREATIRITMDLPVSLHKRLRRFAMSKNKHMVEIGRVIFDKTLPHYDD